MATKEPGKTVNLAQAQTYLTRYLTVMQDNEKLIREFAESKGGILKDYFNALVSKSNTFLFHKSHLTRFFEGDEQAEYLLIINGIREVLNASGEHEKWEPTVVIMGCNTETGEDIIKNKNVKLKHLKKLDGEEGSEYPDFLPTTEVPDKKDMIGGDFLIKL